MGRIWSQVCIKYLSKVIFRFKKRRRDVTASRLLKKHGPEASWKRQLFSLGGAGMFFLAGAYLFLVIVLGFLGQRPPLPPILPDQRAISRVVAEFSFHYTSEIQTQTLRDDVARRTPPVYRIDYTVFGSFEQFIERLADFLIDLEETGNEFADASDREELILEFLEAEPFEIDPQSIAVLATLTPLNRARIFQQGLGVLWEIHQRGIAGASTLGADSAQWQGAEFLQIETDDGIAERVSVQRENRALLDLRIRLGELNISDDLFPPLHEILRHGISDNLTFSRESSQARLEQALAEVDPIVIYVARGETLIEPGAIMSSLEVERFNAYRQAFREQFSGANLFDNLFQQRAFLVLGIFLLALTFLQTATPGLLKDRRKIILVAVAIVVNILIVRLISMAADSEIWEAVPALASVLPYAIPIAFGALLTTILAGPQAGVVTAVTVSFLAAVMLGNDIELLIASFLSSLVGIFVCRELHARGRLLRAAVLTGITMAVFISINGLFISLDWVIILQQVSLAIAVAILSGLIILGILPLAEKLFNFTTEITLLELTDFNHPLLRRMQIEAPGTYHHSLMVANLSEKAAAEIGASPLLCRTCSLYHDIGKMVKPEYFTENQAGGYNPHLEKNPSMSALVIKAHVKEGVEMARQWKLPRVFIDVIRQHHGTTLIKYFYFEALQRQKRDPNLQLFPNPQEVDYDKVDEGTYRYDGPKPLFKESAIIFLADSVEAASRSLKKVTSQSVEELLDKIFQQRIDDRQLDDCPITFQELALIKKSFLMTLLNMLHTRIEYPSESQTKALQDATVPAEKDNSNAANPNPEPS